MRTLRRSGERASGRRDVVVHVCKSAVPGCPRQDLCYGEICVAPEVCHDPTVRAQPDEWRRLDELFGQRRVAE